MPLNEVDILAPSYLGFTHVMDSSEGIPPPPQGNWPMTAQYMIKRRITHLDTTKKLGTSQKSLRLFTCTCVQ